MLTWVNHRVLYIRWPIMSMSGCRVHPESVSTWKLQVDSTDFVPWAHTLNHRLKGRVGVGVTVSALTDSAAPHTHSVCFLVGLPFTMMSKKKQWSCGAGLHKPTRLCHTHSGFGQGCVPLQSQNRFSTVWFYCEKDDDVKEVVKDKKYKTKTE